MENGKPTLLIAGYGLLGSSLGMALKGKDYRILAWARKREVAQWAAGNGAADEPVYDLAEGLSRADMVIFCLPIPAIIEYLERCRDFFKPGCVVTDIGSVKGPIMAAAAKHGINFVGSHPMAGTEKSGHLSGFGRLYEKADVFVCRGTASEEAVNKVFALWRAAGGIPKLIEPEKHDNLVAHTSHVLHVIASSLVLSILNGGSEEADNLRFAGCATGFRDTSRIASSSPAMWREIIESNADEVLAALKDFDREYEIFRDLIKRGDFDGFEKRFSEGKILRDKWLRYKENE